MDRRSYLKTSLAVGGSLLAPAGVLALVGCSGTSRLPELAGFDGKIMGTGYSVRLGLSFGDNASKLKALEKEVYATLNDVDIHMSTWRADSELSLFNDSNDGDWQVLTPATTRVIAHALDTSVASGGVFDATVGPLVDLWGFGPRTRTGTSTDAGAEISSSATNTYARRPSAKAISQTLAQIGSDSIDVDLKTNTVRKLNPSSRLDLSGIAKGHAVDRVASLLDEQGFDSYLVEVGGELKARGRKPDAIAWKVAIERPLAGQRDVFRILNLENAAIATSGDYRNFFADGGQRFSHSIDPRTGAPVGHELASVSVVATSTMAADALSTALMIMGPDEAMQFAQEQQIAAHLILKSGSSLKEAYSPAFESLLS